MLLANEQLWSIGASIVLGRDNNEHHLPSSVKKMIVKCLVLCCSSSSSNETTSTQRLEQLKRNIIDPLSARLDALNERLLSPSTIHTEWAIKEAMCLVETLNGIVEGTSPSLVSFLLPFVLTRCQQGVHLLDIYHNYAEIVELILCLFNGVIERFLPHLNSNTQQSAVQQTYECFLHLIQVFSKHNAGKRSVEANVQEDYFNDLLLFMTLLNTLHNIENDEVTTNCDNRFLTNQSSNKTSNLINLLFVRIIRFSYLYIMNKIYFNHFY